MQRHSSLESRQLLLHGFVPKLVYRAEDHREGIRHDLRQLLHSCHIFKTGYRMKVF